MPEYWGNLVLPDARAFGLLPVRLLDGGSSSTQPNVRFVPIADIESRFRVSKNPQAFARGCQPSRPNAPRPVAMTQTKMNCTLSVQCGSLDFLICSARATLQSTHIRVGSIGLVYTTHIGARHCAHWLMNEREVGINMSATSGHARTSADLSTGMH